MGPRELILTAAASLSPVAIGIAALLTETESPTPIVVALVSLLTVTGGCLVWVTRHLLTRTIPDMQRDAKEQLGQIVSSCEAHQEAMGRRISRLTVVSIRNGKLIRKLLRERGGQ